MLKKKVLFRQYVQAVDRVSDTVGNTKTFFASLNDLIRMKKAAGRSKDLLDLDVLKKLKERKKRKRKSSRLRILASRTFETEYSVRRVRYEKGRDDDKGI